MKDLFSAQPPRELEGKRIAVWGFDDDARRRFFWTLNQRIHIDCFLDEQSRDDLRGTRYLNKPVVSLNTFAADGRDDLIMASRSQRAEVAALLRERQMNNELLPMLNPAIRNADAVIIYGTAVLGEQVYELLQSEDVAATAFADTYADERDVSTLHGLPILSPAELAARHPKAAVVIASQYVDDISATLREHGFGDEQMCVYRKDALIEYDGYQGKFKICTNGWRVENPFVTIDLIVQNFTGKHLVLWGYDTCEILAFAHVLRLLDIDVAYIIDESSESAYIEDEVKVCPKSALLKESHDTANVLAFVKKSDVLRFIGETGVDGRMFGSIAFGMLLDCSQLNRLDASLGYITRFPQSDMAGIVTLRRETNPGKQTLKVAILGNSTSLLSGFGYTWSELLVEVASRRGHNIELWNAAVGAYIVAQELVRLERDLIPYRPNVIISCSGVKNMDTASVEGYPFLQDLQQELFELLASQLHKEVSYGRPLPPTQTCMTHWADCQRMMHAVCAEFGIRFYGILQPMRSCCEHLNEVDLETIASHLRYSREELLATVLDSRRNMVAEARKALASCEWFHDASRLLEGRTDGFNDDYHMNEKGAAILAEYVYDIIFNDK